MGLFLAPFAHRIADGRLLQFDDLGPVIRQQLAAKRPGNHGAHLNDANIRKRPRAGGRFSAHFVRMSLFLPVYPTVE